MLESCQNPKKRSLVFKSRKVVPYKKKVKKKIEIEMHVGTMVTSDSLKTGIRHEKCLVFYAFFRSRGACAVIMTEVL